MASLPALALVFVIGVDRFVEVFMSLAILGAGLAAGYQAGWRRSLLVMGAAPVLLIRFWPLIIPLVFVGSILLFGAAMLVPLMLMQYLVFRMLG